MRERLAAMLGGDVAEQLFAGTFHSLCYRLLKRHIDKLSECGRTQSFTLYDQARRRAAGLGAADLQAGSAGPRMRWRQAPSVPAVLPLAAGQGRRLQAAPNR